VEDHAPLIERAFSLSPCEDSYCIQQAEGQVPDFIHGTYYLNGPARFQRAGLRYRHWLDGDGMICALRFDKMCVRFTSRFVRSHKFVAEEEAGHPIFRAFGTAFDSDRLKRGIGLESPVNVSVYPYAGTLLAFGEQGLPWELDPVTLETRGEFKFGGRLNAISPFAAHPRFDPHTGEMFNFGVAYAADQPLLNLYRFDRSANLVSRSRLRLDFPCSMHDFGLSPAYAVFYVSPYILDMQALLGGGCTLMQALRWEPERGSRLLIVSRDTGKQVASVPVGNRYCLHLANCFEEQSRLTVDVLELERPVYDQYQEVPDLFTTVSQGYPVRLVVDVARGVVLERREINYRLAPDFPSVDPRLALRPCQDFWMLGISATGREGRKFFDQLVHGNWADGSANDIYQAPPCHYLGGEPVFIPDPGGHNHGVVICQLFDAQRVTGAFAIFDALHVARGPVAVLRLKSPVALSFHAAFHPATPYPRS
jgi:all-trans-8'-apo-beta-carotenal 15,15'-oxygenase